MTDLHQRLSDATEGARELDCAVWTETGGWEGVDHPPAYTASLDAALALAERLHPCWSWSVGRNVHSQYWLAYALGLDDDRSAIQMTTATAMTGPLALCLAILKAKASNTGVGG